MGLSLDVKHAIVNYIKNNIHKFTELNVTWFGGEPLLALNDIREMSREFMKICTLYSIHYVLLHKLNILYN